MRILSIYPTFQSFFARQQEQFLARIQAVSEPEIIYLLGGSFHREKNESIFSVQAPTKQYVSAYFLLILIKAAQGRPLYDLQDRIEQSCKTLTPITAMVMETAAFHEWLNAGNPFARKVTLYASPVYVKDNIPPLPVTAAHVSARPERPGRQGLHKAAELLGAAQLLIHNQLNNTAAFMLHQACEQSLAELIKTATGFRSHTHNLDRLLKYACMITYELKDVFPKHNEKEIRLFTLLAQAYSDTRYQSDYSISLDELHLLFERVTAIYSIARQTIETIHKND